MIGVKVQLTENDGTYESSICLIGIVLNRQAETLCACICFETYLHISFLSLTTQQHKL